VLNRKSFFHFRLTLTAIWLRYLLLTAGGSLVKQLLAYKMLMISLGDGEDHCWQTRTKGIFLRLAPACSNNLAFPHLLWLATAAENFRVWRTCPQFYGRGQIFLL